MSTDNPCPGCGLAVPAGYPRCPRCHAAMPTSLPAPPPRGGPRDPGGTSLADDDDGSRRPLLLIGAVVLAVVVVVVAVVILMRSDGEGDKTEEAPVGQRSQARPAAGPADPDEAPGSDQPDEPPAPGAAPSAAALDAELQNRRLWAKVEVEGTVAVVSSAYCADPGMSASLNAAKADLLASGITAVRCNESFGPLVFERPLR